MREAARLLDVLKGFMCAAFPIHPFDHQGGADTGRGWVRCDVMTCGHVKCAHELAVLDCLTESSTAAAAADDDDIGNDEEKDYEKQEDVETNACFCTWTGTIRTVVLQCWHPGGKQTPLNCTSRAAMLMQELSLVPSLRG